MGGVFAAAAQAPLTAIASVAEMTGNFTLTLPIMLACGIAAAVSKRLTYGNIYTTKLLRRGIDIERPRTTEALSAVVVADVMQRIPQLARRNGTVTVSGQSETDDAEALQQLEELVGPVADSRQAQAVIVDETLEQALRQLVLYGQAGLPVLSHDGHLEGWITRQGVLRIVADRIRTDTREIQRGAVAAEFALVDPVSAAHEPSSPLAGHKIVELAVGADSPALGRRIGQLQWPQGSFVVAATRGREIVPLRSDSKLTAGERVILLIPTSNDSNGGEPGV